jgi:hypothetical protein
MSEKFVEKLGEVVGRRSIIRTLSAASAAFALGLFDFRKAEASGPAPCFDPTVFQVACCCLCKDPRSCNCDGTVCSWTWTCNAKEWIGRTRLPDPSDPSGWTCRRYTCRECYSAGACHGGCDANIKCSRATYTTVANWNCGF